MGVGFVRIGKLHAVAHRQRNEFAARAADDAVYNRHRHQLAVRCTQANPAELTAGQVFVAARAAIGQRISADPPHRIE